MDIQEYSNNLNNFVGSKDFAALNPQQQQESIAGARNWYIEQNPNVDPEQVDRITQGTNVQYLRNTGQGRALPIININLPNKEEGFDALNKEEKLKKIDEYKLKIPEIASTVPTQKEDAEYFMNQSVRELERQVNGADTGYIADKGKRLVEGFAAGLASGIGAESAAEGIQDFFHENTKYDEDFTAQLAQGLGSAGSSVLIIAGAAAASGGLGATPAVATAIGTGASLASNGIMRYNEGYKNAIKNGLNEDQAHEMGVSAMPAAVIDALSDRIIASKLMPKEINKVFATGTSAARAKMFTEITKDVTLRGKMVGWAEAAITEGLSESVGDYAAAYGPYKISGDEKYLPSEKESLNSFAIGALIGGGIATVGDVPNIVGNKTGAARTTIDANGNEVKGEAPKYSTKDEMNIRESQLNIEQLADANASSDVYKLLSEGKYKEARQVSDAMLNKTVAEDTSEEAATEGTETGTGPTIDIEATVVNTPNATDTPAVTPATEVTPANNPAATPAANPATVINVNEAAGEKAKLDSISFVLPKELKGASPRYGNSNLTFESDFDRAAYILAGDSKKGASKSAGKFREALKGLGLTDAQVIAHGQKVRESIKNLQPTVTGEKITTTVPAIKFESALKAKKPASQTASTAMTQAQRDLEDVRRTFGHIPEGIEETLDQEEEVAPVVAAEVAPEAPIINVNEASNPEVVLTNASNPTVNTPNGTRRVTVTTVANEDGTARISSIKLHNDENGSAERFLAPENNFPSMEAAETAGHEIVQKKYAETPSQAIQSEVDQSLNTQGVPDPTKTAVDPKLKVSSLPAHTFLQAFKKHIPADKLAAYNQLIIDVKLKNPKLRFTLERAAHYPIEAAGLYDGAKNLIYLSSLDYRTLSHEVAHALTMPDIWKFVESRPGSYKENLVAALQDPNVPIHVKTLIDVYLTSAKKLGLEHLVGMDNSVDNISQTASMPVDHYGFTSLAEFVAEAFSNQSFQEQLSEIIYNGKSLWEHFVDAVRNSMEWMRNISNPELTLRSNGNNALVATLAVSRTIIDSDIIPTKTSDSIKFLPENNNQDEFFKEMQEKINNRIKTSITTDLSVGDEVWTITGGRGKFISHMLSKNGVANILVEFATGEKSSISFDRILLSQPDSQDILMGLAKVYSEMKGGDTKAEFLKSAENKGYDLDEAEAAWGINGMESPEVININYLPIQTRGQKLANSFERMANVTQGKITDSVDTPTQRIIGLLKDIKNSDIMRLPDELQDYFFELIDNIYESRKSAVKNPQIRVNSDEMINRITAVKRAIDSDRIADMIEDYDDLIDFDKLGIDLTDRKAVQQAVNDYMIQDQVADLARRQNLSDKAKARTQALYQKYRTQYNQMKQKAKERFADKDNYTKEIESIYGSKLTDFPNLQRFLGFHYDYLMSVDTSALEGKALYEHFFAINNLIDGNFTGMGSLTAAHLGKMQDAAQDIAKLKGTFHDPVSTKNFMIRTLDKINRMVELQQVQLQRLSASGTTVAFIQEKLLGPFYDGIIRVAHNQKMKYTDEYAAFRDALLGRDSTAEDKQVCAIMGRLAQFQQGEDPDAALLRNIKKERESIRNKINGAVSESARKQYKTEILPLLNGIVKGLEEYGEGAMVHFMNTFAERARGTQDIKTGDQRMKLVGKSQEIFSRYTLASRILSEGFLNKTFNQQINYIPNDVRSTTLEEGKPVDIVDLININDPNFNKKGITKEEAHYKERQTSLGRDGYYSYNNENILKRNVERLSVDHATLPERFVIKSRLKQGSELNKLITGSGDEFTNQRRVEYINSLISQVYSNATSGGTPLNGFTEVLNAAVGLYSRVTLSSIHHVISQNVAAITDYGIRTGDLKGWFDAATYYAANFDKVNQWFKENQRWTYDRSALEAMSLDNRRTPQDDKGFKDTPYFKWLSNFHEKAGNILTTSLHLGDNFSTKVTVLAEYQRLRKAKGYQFNNISDIDFDVTEGQLLTQATLNAEKIVNTSNKALRGDFFSDRNTSTTIIRNLLFAFSAHSASLSSQFNLAVADLIELKSNNIGGGEIESKLRTIGAIFAQQAMFTTARFGVGALAATLIIGLVRDLFDDDDGKIEELETKVEIARKKKDKVKLAHAEAELANAKTVRKMVTKMENNTSTEAWFKQVIRDASGSVHLSLNNQVAQKAVFFVPDLFMGAFARESQKKIEAGIAEEIKVAKERHDFKKVAKLTEQATVLGAAEYIPLAYSNTSGFGMPGIYGSVLDQYYRNVTEAAGAYNGTKDYNWTDWVSAVSTAGLGQAEINKALNLIDAIEDEQMKKGIKLESDLQKIEDEKHKPKKGKSFNFSGFR